MLSNLATCTEGNGSANKYLAKMDTTDDFVSNKAYTEIQIVNSVALEAFSEGNGSKIMQTPRSILIRGFGGRYEVETRR